MIRQSMQKVGKLLRDLNYSVPQFLYKFYAFALYFAQRLDGEDPDYNAITIFADIHKLYKAYLLDQPFRLTKLTIPSLVQQSETAQEFIKLRHRFLQEFPILMPKESFVREVLAETGDLSWAEKMQGMLKESLEVKKQLQAKKKTEGVKHSELTILFWYRQFKGDYLVGVDNFIDHFISFAKQHLPVLSFLNRFSSHALKQLADPQHKHFLTIINCEDLLFKLRDPAVLQRLWMETQESKQDEPFQSIHMLAVTLLNTIDSSQLKLSVSGQKVGDKPVQSPAVIFVGSALDNDIVIKSKYVSRKQVLIVQDKRQKKGKEGDLRSFSAVCLSQTNFTSVKYPRPFKLHIGDIFYSGKIKYQVLRLQKDSMEFSAEQEEEEDRTLTMLPSQRPEGVPSNCQRATFLILSGEDKEKELSLSSKQVGKMTEPDGKHEWALSQQLVFEEQFFFLRIGTKVLLKNANEILQNRLSKKVRLSKGMEICLQEYSLIIE